MKLIYNFLEQNDEGISIFDYKQKAPFKYFKMSHRKKWLYKHMLLCDYDGISFRTKNTDYGWKFSIENTYPFSKLCIGRNAIT